MQKKLAQAPRYCDFLRANLPEWKDLSNEEIDFHLFSSITNKVYKVTPSRKDISPDSVILRHFCGEEGIIDLAKELKVFDGMSQSGAGPKCYGQEGDLRIEEYFPTRIIEAHEYNQKPMRRKLARAVAAMHKTEIVGIDTEPLYEHALNNPSYYGIFDKKCNKQDIYSPEEKEIIEIVRVASDKSEREFIRKILPTNDLVLSHNDLLEGNVLVTQDNDVRFIDYEYASYNFRGYDIGNMYREARIDYTVSEAPYFKIVESNYPNEEELRDFIRYYIAFCDMDQSEQKTKGDELINDDEKMKAYLQEKYKPEELKKREDTLYREAKIGTMLSAYYWMIWAVKMFQTNDAQFDYLTFAKTDFEYYQRLKADLLASEKITL